MRYSSTGPARLLADGVDAVAAALKRRAFEHKLTLCVGRSHGVHAEPTSFGLKLAGHYAEFARAAERLKAARREIATCAISGPVGTFASVDPAVEAHVAAQMGLAPEPVSTQVIPRDRHAMYLRPCSASSPAPSSGWRWKFATCSAAKWGRWRRPSARAKKGSSAMPHKKNPILTENLTGLARIVRAAVTPALENIALWHERDISHSAVERVFAPDAAMALDFALTRLAGVVDGLVIDEAGDAAQSGGPRRARL